MSNSAHALSIHQGDWVVVCDGAKALILENAGDAKFPNLQTRDVYEHKAAATHELGTDKPGRTGGASSAIFSKLSPSTLKRARVARSTAARVSGAAAR